MKTLYIECAMGAAGDMLTAALLELVPNPDEFIEQMNSLGLKGVSVSRHKAQKCGIWGTQMQVQVNGEEEQSVDVSPEENIHAEHTHKQAHSHSHAHDEHSHAHTHEHAHEGHSHPHSHVAEHIHHHGDAHPHTHEHAHEGHSHPHTQGDAQEHHHAHGEEHGNYDMQSVKETLQNLPLKEEAKADALAVYELIAQAEANAHGCLVEQVHFHEVGSMDALADIVGVAILMHMLKPDRVVASAVNVGSGQVRCSHGVLPVPAPATAWLLQGVPTYSGPVRAELCTPTGAALLRHFVSEFALQPVMSVDKIGYGMGKKDFAAANCVRAFLGEEQTDAFGSVGRAHSVSVPKDSEYATEQVAELSCNIDDMTGEALGYAQEVLFESGALDVYLIPIYMKKSRGAHMLCCLCKPEDEHKMVSLMLKHTTSLGVRIARLERKCLERSVETMQTPLGQVRLKRGFGGGVQKCKAEYEDVAAIARKSGLSLAQVGKIVCEEMLKDEGIGDTHPIVKK